MEKKMRLYTQKELLEAIRLVQNKDLSLNKASKLFGIPYATLGDKIRGRRPLMATPKYLLTSEEEEELVKWIIAMWRGGFRKSADEIKDAVKQILDKRNAKTKCVNNRPGRSWMDYFFKRHPELSCCTPQALGKERATITRESLSTWFEEMAKYVNKEDASLLKSPERLYNAHEAEFSLSSMTKKVVAEKGSEHAYAVTGNKKQLVTVLACSSAAGHYIAPLIIYPYKRVPAEDLLHGFEEACFQISPNGRINGPIFFAWLRDIFIPSVADKKKPVVLFVGGHSSHSSPLKVVDLCIENGIILYCLKSQASLLIQPLDQAFWGGVKATWEKASREYFFQHGENVNLKTFAQVLYQAWKETATPLMSLKGFQASGIFPFDPEKILNSDKLTPLLASTAAKATSYTPTTTDTEDSQPNPSFHAQLPSTSASTDTSSTPQSPPLINVSNELPQSFKSDVSSASVSLTSSNPSQENISLSLNDVRSLCNFVLKLGQGRTETYFDLYQKNVIYDNTEFESFKAMVNTILQVSPPSSSSCPIPDHPAIPQTLGAFSTTCDILSMPTFSKSKREEYSKKEEEEKKEAAAKQKELLNKVKRDKKKKGEQKEILKRKREEGSKEARRQKKEGQKVTKKRKWNEYQYEVALRKMEREMQKKSAVESESDENDSEGKAVTVMVMER